MKNTLLLLLVSTFSLLISAQQSETMDFESDKAAVKSLVERFLIAAGNYDVDAMPEMFSKKANIGGASFRDGKWNTFTMTFVEFLELLKSRSNPTKYTEPVSKFTIHMEKGMLAFVKADAILKVNGKPKKNNFDYFTLIKENGNWKILNGSYVSVPIEN
ncbi:nuclear transport factor 2 family protein [Flavobacteriaceae bacterium AH-315-B10]|nr:nuclear transport factor 2 family protein [Flavobacteriaceae bacterium AH-315-B10]